MVVQDTQLKAVIESKLDVKCWTGDQVVEEVIWGLKYVMPHFILEERNKITDNYFLPLSKQLLEDLQTNRINVSTSELTAGIINLFGYVKVLDKILKKLSKALCTKCDCYFSDIIVSEDDMTYASMIAKVLFPEFKEEIGLPEIAGGLGSKLMDLPKGAGKAIANSDKQEILESLKRLSHVCKEKRRAFQKLLEIEAQIGVARMAVRNEAVGKDDEGKTNTKGSNKDGGSGKKCETEVTNKGKTETMGSRKDDRFANNGETNQWRYSTHM